MVDGLEFQALSFLKSCKKDENFCDNRCLKLIRLGEIGLMIIMELINLAYFVNMADSSRLLLLLLLLLFFSSSSASSA